MRQWQRKFENGQDYYYNDDDAFVALRSSIRYRYMVLI